MLGIFPNTSIYNVQMVGWPRFGSVRLRFGDATVRTVQVFGSGGSSKEGVLVTSRGWIKGGFGKGGAGNLVVAKIAFFILLA